MNGIPDGRSVLVEREVLESRPIRRIDEASALEISKEVIGLESTGAHVLVSIRGVCLCGWSRVCKNLVDCSTWCEENRLCVSVSSRYSPKYRP